MLNRNMEVEVVVIKLGSVMQIRPLSFVEGVGG
jgi:hypothetical protein